MPEPTAAVPDASSPVSNPTRLLVVEDEPAMAAAISTGLSARGYDVGVAATAGAALDTVVDSPPHVIVLDLGLPDGDGLDVCRQIRTWSQVPIIVVTADGDEDRKVAALESGADDYVTKPFSMRELTARVGVAVRHQRLRGPDPAVLCIGDLGIDASRHRASLAGEPLELTPKEFALLALLARNAGRVLTHRRILTEIWGAGATHHLEYLRVYARALRQKLGDGPSRPRIVTAPGVGYQLIEPGGN